MISKLLEEKKVIYIFLILTLIPHIFHLPFLLNIYIIFFIVYIFRFSYVNKQTAMIVFLFLGVFFGGFEYIKYINFTHLIEAKVFIDIVTSLLIYIISLQWISNPKSNFIKISPILLLITSLFYFNSIYYLFYIIMILLIAVNVTIFTNTILSLKQSMKYTFSIFATSIPFVLLLFLIFPRISFKKQDFGFKGESVKVSGFGQSIDIGEGERLLKSDQLVMEVNFLNKMPKEGELYFRGATLYNYDGNRHWSGLKQNTTQYKLYTDNSSTISYNITLYPTQEKNIFALDIPISKIKDSFLDSDLILTSYKPINKIKHYLITSATKYNNIYINNMIKRYSLVVWPDQNPKTKALAKKIVAKSKSDTKRLQYIIDFFKKSGFLYTLEPAKLGSKDKIDEFLFGTKEGYCVHFASAFAILSRYAHLPTRIVTGYKADYKERVNNYILIREKNAHSWNEVYLKNKGWVRVDPTTYSFIKIEKSNSKKTRAISTNRDFRKISILDKTYLHIMYIKFMLDNWIINYDYLKQLRILNNIKKDKTVLLYIFIGFSILISVSYFLYRLLLFSTHKDKVLMQYEKLLKKLARLGYKKEHYEGAMTFLKRIDKKLNSEDLEKIIKMYIHHRYKMEFTRKEYNRFKKMIKKIKF